MKPEALLAKRVAIYLQSKYPNTPFRFDLAADMRVSIGVAKRNKAMHGKYTRGHPDLAIYHATKEFGALFIELKAGKFSETAHIKRQRAYHAVLRNQGYKVDFACGFEEAKLQIDDYMALKKKKVN